MSKKILVIDDDPGILGALEAMLENAGYLVETNLSGNRLLNIKSDNAPDLILLDVLLSGTDGRALCKKLKNQKETQDIPIIMLSAALEVQESVKQAQADDFLEKPFAMQVLIDKVKKYLP